MNWDFAVVLQHLPFLLLGVRTTIVVTVLAMAIGAAVGLVIALLRMSGVRVVEVLAGLYIDLWRSTPLLVQLLWVFYALPMVMGYSLEPFPAGVLTLSLHVSGPLAEVYRAGILSIATGQRHAAAALGMTPAQAFRRVVLPQAVTRMLPPLASQFIGLFKDSALVAMISLRELMFQAQSLANFTLRPFEILSAAAVIYMVLTLPQAMLVNWLHRRFLAH